MEIKITKPRIIHYKEYHQLTLQPDWQREFLNMRVQNIEDTRNEISNWVYNENELIPSNIFAKFKGLKFVN